MEQLLTSENLAIVVLVIVNLAMTRAIVVLYKDNKDAWKVNADLGEVLGKLTSKISILLDRK